MPLLEDCPPSTRPAHDPAHGPAIGLVTASMAAAGAVAGTAWLFGAHLPTVDGIALRAFIAFALLLGLVWLGWPAGDRRRPFGVANLVTLLRAGLICAIAALIGLPWHPAAVAVTVIAIAALALDGVDGWLARRFGEVSDFGARFDMESDASFGLVLSLLAWQGGLAGAWVLLAGLSRYAFVAAAACLPWLGRPLPASVRRKALCVAQLALLIACVAPVLPMPLRTGAALLAVAVVLLSFAIDGAWLLRRRADRIARGAG